jgi:hypothetical protein
VLNHGHLVHKYYLDWRNNQTDGWKIPANISKNREWLLDNLCDSAIIQGYQVIHDCGKPACRIVDDLGKVHFPNHAERSYEVAIGVGLDPIVANLIRHDMFFHTCSALELEDKLKIWDIKFVNTLLVTALAELHANASMFGGIESTSFKIKFKQLDRRSKYLENKDEYCKSPQGEKSFGW